jgi:hypothetical protein
MDFDIKVDHFGIFVENALKIITVYKSPADYKNKYVARIFFVVKGDVQKTPYVMVRDTLEEIEDMIPLNMSKLAPHPDDESQILFSYL